MPKKKESRSQPRIVLHDFSQIHIANLPKPIIPLDLSLQGLRVRTQEFLEPDTEVNVYLFNQTLECKARVRWIQKSMDEADYEAGLQLQYPDIAEYQEIISHLPKFSGNLKILILTPIDLSTRALGKYFGLLGVTAVSVSYSDEVLASLTQHPWDLLILDMEAENGYELLQTIASHPVSLFLPILMLTRQSSFHQYFLHAMYPFIEIFPKPARAHELLRRAIFLMEQTSRYLEVERRRKHAENQLSHIQQAMAQQSAEMMEMLSQVMRQSESMGQLIQLQEAWLGLETFDHVVEFAQQWAKENYNILINLWSCEGDFCAPLGINVFTHPKFDQKQRTAKIQGLLQQRTHILHDEVILIRKNEWILEIVSDLSNSDIIDAMTFFMKVLAPVFVTKRLELDLHHALEKIETILQVEKKAKS